MTVQKTLSSLLGLNVTTPWSNPITGSNGNDIIFAPLPTAQPTSANLLVNGSFEAATGVVANGFAYLANGKVAGWTSTIATEVWNNGFNGVGPSDGKNVVEIDAGNGALSQSVKTAGGQSYDLSFDFAGRPGALASSKFEVVWNGQVIATISPTGSTMTQGKVTVTGTGGNDTLSFRSLAGDNDTYGALLDNVALKATPTPGPGSNLLVNGSFEAATGAVANSFAVLANGKVAGWTSAIGTEVWNNGFNGVAPSDGKNVVEIDAGNGELSQSVKTAAGTSYDLSFDFAGRPGALASSKFDVVWNGQVLATIIPSDSKMAQGKITVIGTGGNDTVSFRAVAGDNDGLGALLDNVVLKAANHYDDWVYGDAAPNASIRTVDLGAASTWAAVSANKTSIGLTGMKITAIGGVFDAFKVGSVEALGILSPNDDPTKIYAREIDAYADAAEHVKLDFELAQESVTLTLQQLYKDYFLSWDLVPEKADLLIGFTDGTTATKTVLATQTAQPGEATVTLNAADFGGRLIASIDIAPSPDLAPQRPDLPDQYKNSPDATRPYSTFVVKSVSYLADPNASIGGHDTLVGSFGNDKLYGGVGDDCLVSGCGDDLLVGGSGNNSLWGSIGRDTFAFGWQSKGHDVIGDFDRIGGDRILLGDGITVTSTSYSSAGTLLHLSSGGDVLLAGVKVADWHTLL